MSNFTKPLTGIIQPGLNLLNLFEDVLYAAEEMLSEGSINKMQHAVFYSFIDTCVPWLGEGHIHSLLSDAIPSQKLLLAILDDAQTVNSPNFDVYIPFKTAVSVRDLLLIDTMLLREIFDEKKAEELFNDCYSDLEYSDFDANAFKERVNVSLLTRDFMVRWSNNILPKKERKAFVVR